MQKKATFHEWLESLNPLMGLILAFSLAVKSSYLWSFHLLDYTKLPKPVPDILNVATGMGIALALETLTITAGAKAWYQFQASKDIEFNTQYSKRQRLAMIAKARADVMIHGLFAGFGGCASTFAMVYFATGHISTGNPFGDIVIALSVQVAVMYIGIFFTPTQANPFADLMASGYGTMRKIGDQYASDIAAGNFDNRKIRAMQAMLPPDLRGTFDALIVADGKVPLWDSTQITRFLLARFSQSEQDLMFETAQRNVRNRLNHHKQDATYGIMPKSKGGGLVIPADSMFVLFQEEIERAIVGSKPFVIGRKRPARQAPITQDGSGIQGEQERQADGNGTSEPTQATLALAE